MMEAFDAHRQHASHIELVRWLRRYERVEEAMECVCAPLTAFAVLLHALASQATRVTILLHAHTHDNHMCTNALWTIER